MNNLASIPEPKISAKLFEKLKEKNRNSSGTNKFSIISLSPDVDDIEKVDKMIKIF